MSEFGNIPVEAHEVRKLRRGLYLVGEHQYVGSALIAALSPRFLRKPEYWGDQLIVLNHIDAHGDMEQFSLHNNLTTTELRKAASEVAKLRKGEKTDTGFLLKLVRKVWKSQAVTFLATIGLVDVVRFIANTGYDFDQSLAHGVLCREIPNADESNHVGVEFYTLSSLPGPRLNALNVFDIDTDIMPFLKSSNRRREESPAQTVVDFANGLKERGLRVGDNNQITVVSYDKFACGESFAGTDLLIKSL